MIDDDNLSLLQRLWESVARAKITVSQELRKTPQQGAATSVLLVASPLLDGIGGRYFVDCNEAEVVHRRPDGMGGVAPYALDTVNVDRLWEASLSMLAD